MTQRTEYSGLLTKAILNSTIRGLTMGDMNLGLSDAARSLYHLLSNRRKYERVPVSGSVRATYLGYAAGDICSCVNISPGGMAVDSADSMMKGAVVVLYSDQHHLKRLARVCHCQLRDGMYRIGLEFTTDTNSRLS